MSEQEKQQDFVAIDDVIARAIASQKTGFNFKDFLLYTILTLMLVGGVGFAVFSAVQVLPDYKRKSIVYEIYTDCIELNQKDQCSHILKKLGGK